MSFLELNTLQRNDKDDREFTCTQGMHRQADVDVTKTISAKDDENGFASQIDNLQTMQMGSIAYVSLSYTLLLCSPDKYIVDNNLIGKQLVIKICLSMKYDGLPTFRKACQTVYL